MTGLTGFVVQVLPLVTARVRGVSSGVGEQWVEGEGLDLSRRLCIGGKGHGHLPGLWIQSVGGWRCPASGRGGIRLKSTGAQASRVHIRGPALAGVRPWGRAFRCTWSPCALICKVGICTAPSWVCGDINHAHSSPGAGVS